MISALSYLRGLGVRMKHAKFIQCGDKVRMGIYVPSFPSKPFYSSLKIYLPENRTRSSATATISVTDDCNFECDYCFQKHDRGDLVPIETLISSVKKLQDLGVALFIFEGGDPFLRFDRLEPLVSALDDRSEVWLNATGDGATHESVKRLIDLGFSGIRFSMHHWDPEKHNAFLGSDKGWEALTNGIQICHDLNLPVTVMSRMTAEDFYDGTFEKFMDRAREFGAHFVQFNKPRCSGGYLHHDPFVYTAKDMDYFEDLVDKYNSDSAFASYPSIYIDEFEEGRVFGCGAGGVSRFYINAQGEVQPCQHIHLSFGNITTQNVEDIFLQMRGKFLHPSKKSMCGAFSPHIAKALKDKDEFVLPLRNEEAQSIINHVRIGEEL